MSPAETFLDAAEAFADQVAELPSDLVGPGLGEWDLRALVGHASRSVLTVSSYLGQPAQQGEGEAAEGGRQAGVALGDAPAAAVRHMVETVADELVAAVEDPVITTIAGGM